MIQYNSQEIKFDKKNETLLEAICSLSNGFDYIYIRMKRSGFLAVVDVRRTAQSVPVGVLSNFTANSVEEVEFIVNKMIYLYKNREVISVLCTAEEFLDNFNKIV